MGIESGRRLTNKATWVRNKPQLLYIVHLHLIFLLVIVALLSLALYLLKIPIYSTFFSLPQPQVLISHPLISHLGFLSLLGNLFILLANLSFIFVTNPSSRFSFPRLSHLQHPVL